MVRAVSITTADVIRDTEGAPVFDADTQNMLLPRIQFTGVRDLRGDEVDAWWARVASLTRSALQAYLADPPAPTPFDETLGDLTIMFPVPRALLSDADYDVAGEMLPEVEETATMSIRHEHGDHSTCWRDAPCRIRQRVRPSA